MRSKLGWMAGGLLVLVAVGGVLAQGWLWDIPAEHPQETDIAYAIEKGWFVGYEDGSFRPDEEITPKQMTIVLERFGRLTRADAATLLTAGHKALRKLETTDTTAPPWYVQECDPVCLHRSKWSPNEVTGVGGTWRLTFVSGQHCGTITIAVEGNPEPRAWVEENEPGNTTWVRSGDNLSGDTLPKWSATCAAT